MSDHLKTYLEALEYQTQEWVAGRPWHNPFEVDDTRHDGDRSKGECCPDFSCCMPDMLAPKEAREAFAAADEKTRESMLFGFLGNAVSTASNDKVYLAADPDIEQSGNIQ